ncbi:hypothetical protein J2X53_000081 [Pseudorhodobacter sp. 4114]|nr:hypothetical protein [Pseudorhodobacter sp. 4114]
MSCAMAATFWRVFAEFAVIRVIGLSIFGDTTQLL